MQDHIDNFKNKNTKKIIKASIMLLASLLFIFLLFGTIIYPKILNDKVETINKKAKNHFNFFTAYFNDLSNTLDLPDKGSYYLIGECNDNEYYLVYAGDNVPTDTVIYGNKKEKINGYWAINIIDDKIVQVWSSNSPLSKKQLIPYTIKKQKKQFKIFESTLNTNTIGYYQNTN